MELGARARGKAAMVLVLLAKDVVSLQVNTAGIMAMNRMDRIVLDPVRTYACTRTASTGVRVTYAPFVFYDYFRVQPYDAVHTAYI